MAAGVVDGYSFRPPLSQPDPAASPGVCGPSSSAKKATARGAGGSAGAGRGGSGGSAGRMTSAVMAGPGSTLLALTGKGSRRDGLS